MDIVKLGIEVDSRKVRTATKDLDRLEKEGGQAEKSVRGVGRALTALGGVISTRQIIAYSDAWQGASNQLRQVTDSTAELAVVQQSLLDVANKTRADFDATATLYSRLALASGELGLTQRELIGITTTINQSLASSGANAAETAGAIRQLAQGLASGALRGDEFNSVSEQAPGIMRAIAKSLDLTIGELREFAATGGITAKIVVRALQESSKEIADNFSRSVATFGQSMTVANNNITEFVGNSALVSGAVSGMGGLLVTASENIDSFGDALTVAATVMTGRYIGALTASTAASITDMRAKQAAAVAEKAAAAADLQKAASANTVAAADLAAARAAAARVPGFFLNASAMSALTAAETAATAASNAHTAALTRFGVASKAASVGARALGGALALVGGPVGLAATAAIGIGIWALRNREAAIDTDQLSQKVDALLGNFEKLKLAQFDETIDEVGRALKQAEDKLADLQKASDSIDKLLFVDNDLAPSIEKASNEVNRLTGELNDLKKARDKVGSKPIITEVPAAETAITRAAETATPSGPSQFETLEADLQRQIALYGNVKEAVEIRYDVENNRIEGLKAGQGELLISLGAELDNLQAKAKAAEEAKEAQDRLRASQEAYRAEIDALVVSSLPAAEQELRSIREDMLMLNLALEEFPGKADQINDAIARLSQREQDLINSTQGVTDEISIFAEQAARNIQDSLGNAINDLINGTEEWERTFIKSLLNIISQAAAADLASSLGLPGAGAGGNLGGLASAAGSLFGGFFADGGRPDPRKISVVGERGPELFIPDGVKGTVQPNGQSQQVNVNAVTVLDANSIAGVLSSPELGSTFINQARINRSEFRAALGINT